VIAPPSYRGRLEAINDPKTSVGRHRATSALRKSQQRVASVGDGLMIGVKLNSL
jgi:hypothetical protein